MENIKKEYYESGALLHEYSVRDGRKHGPYRRYYESGALRMSATYRDGFMEGPEEEFFENGRLQVRRVYCHGEVADSVVVALNPDGTLSEVEEWNGGRCRSYDSDRRLVREFGLLNGDRDGLYITYFPDGTVHEMHMFARGLRHGRNLTYYENGNIMYDDSWVEGRRLGRCKKYFENGNLQSSISVNEKGPDGEMFRYYEDGTLRDRSVFVDGQLEGEDLNYHPNGQLARRFVYRAGLLTGVASCYYDNGQLEWEREYENGIVKDSTVTVYQEDGSVRGTEVWENGIARAYSESGELLYEGGYVNQQEMGEHKAYYANGQVSRKMHFNKGRLEGEGSMYDEMGNLTRESVFVNDKLDGDDLFYYPGGGIRERIRYDMGRPLAHEEYYRSGAVLWRYTLQGGARNGISYQYLEDGSLFCEMPFNDNKAEGIAKYYDKEGRVCRESLYADDQYCGGNMKVYYPSGRLNEQWEMLYEVPNGEETVFYENGTVAAKIRYKRGMPVDGQYENHDENGNPDGHYEFRNGLGKLVGPDGEIRMEWVCYRNHCNGRCRIIDCEDGDFDGYMVDDIPCDTFEEFLDGTFALLAAKCAARFADESAEGAYKRFFARAYNRAVKSVAAQVEYDDYAEFKPRSVYSLTDSEFVDYLVREFVLRLRLPNDGDTEKRIARGLKKMLGI